MFDVWTCCSSAVRYVAEAGLEIAPFIMGFILGRSAALLVKSLESFGTDDLLHQEPDRHVLWVADRAVYGYSVIR